jgi:hypothetical protein
MKIIARKDLKLKEDYSNPTTYTIVPKKQDARNRDADQQIRDLKGKAGEEDDILVSPQAVNESTKGKIVLTKEQKEKLISYIIQTEGKQLVENYIKKIAEKKPVNENEIRVLTKKQIREEVLKEKGERDTKKKVNLR